MTKQASPHEKTADPRAQLEALQATVAQLEADNQTQQTRLAEQQEAHQQALAEKDRLLSEQKQRIEQLQEQLALLLSKRFGRQSEQLKHLQGQLFDEAELETAIRETEAALAEELQADEADNETEDGADSQDAEPPRPKPKRTELPAHLKRVDVEVDVSDEDKQMMGDDWVLIGHEVSEQVAVKEREYYVKRIKRAKYVRKTPASDADEPIAPDETPGIKLAPPLPSILPKAIADASLLADIITGKFVDALSFYRYERILSREGITIGYSTLCDWPIQLAKRLAPIRELLHEALTDSPLWHLDETTLQVMGEAGRANTQTSYLWAIRAGPPGQPVILFHYHPRRNLDALNDWLSPYAQRFGGVLVTDEHKPYNGFVKQHPSIRAHGGCWAHCRRKFADAAKGRKTGSDAHTLLKQIGVLYRLEQKLGERTGEARKSGRQETVQPQIEHIRATLEKMAPRYVSSGLMQKAIGYALNNWDKLTAFLEYPDLPLDNNPIENAIRPFTLGRKNWVLSGGPRGADASAFMYSLVETARANGWEPRSYLRALFERFPYARTREEQRALLPMFLKPSELNR